MALSFIDNIGLWPWNKKCVRKYVTHWIRHPDKGSIFDRITRFVRWLPGFVLIPLLKLLGYNGTLLCVAGEVVGHAFYQRHGKKWHIFSVAVNERHRNKGLGTMVVLRVLENAHRKGLDGIVLGSGNSQPLEKIRTKVTTTNELGLGFRCRKGAGRGSIDFIRSSGVEVKITT